MDVYAEQYIARYHEMGPDRRMRVQCLCNYLEEAAGYHADILGVGLEKLVANGLSWVLAKLRLRIYRRPDPGERFRVETWPVSIDRLQFRRDFEVFDTKDKLIAGAVTQWVIINFTTRRLERFPAHISSLCPESPRHALDDGDIRIPPLNADVPLGPSFPIRLADIDQNRHVNNGRYIDFILEAAHKEEQTQELRQLDVLFRAEALRGDVIGTRTQEDENRSAMLHSLFREGDGQELARAQTIWG